MASGVTFDAPWSSPLVLRFVVNDDDHAAGANGLDGLLD
jgi:hypothetical protein